MRMRIVLSIKINGIQQQTWDMPQCSLETDKYYTQLIHLCLSNKQRYENSELCIK